MFKDNLLRKRFEEGLKQYNLTIEEIETWKYDGGDWDYHLSNWRRKYGEVPTPAKKYNCICGQKIENNCYITDDIMRLIIGSCCIKRFLKNGFKRFCTECEEPIRSLKDNLCVICRNDKIHEDEFVEILKEVKQILSCATSESVFYSILEGKKYKKYYNDIYHHRHELIDLVRKNIEEQEKKENDLKEKLLEEVYNKMETVNSIPEAKKVLSDNKYSKIFAKIKSDEDKLLKIASDQLLKKRKYLNVKYSEKDVVKGLGGKWDPTVKKWYVENHQDLELFVDWF